MNHRHMTRVGRGGCGTGAGCGWGLGRAGLPPGPPPPWMCGGMGSPSPAQLRPPQPRPAGFLGAAGLTAFSCSSRSFILLPWRPEAGDRVAGERPEVATGPRRGELATGPGGGGRRRPARSSVRGQGRLRRAAPQAPPALRAPNPAPGRAPARSADPPAGPPLTWAAPRAPP